MPRGERQTTGTAQALLGAKQIAAGERASKRQESIAKKNIVADYVKTGVGALKSVGDYLQQKQSLEQNQEALTLKQNLFSAQYGDQGEQEATRERRRQLEEAEIMGAKAKGLLAKETVVPLVETARAGAKKLGVEADVAVATQPDVVEGVKLGVEKLAAEVRSITVDTDTKEIEQSFISTLRKGQIDLLKTNVNRLNEEITSSIAKTKDLGERRKLDDRRLEINEAYHKALTQDMKDKNLLSSRRIRLAEDEWNLKKDTPEGYAVLRKLEKRYKTAQAKSAEAAAEFAGKSLPDRLELIAKEVELKDVEIGTKKMDKLLKKHNVSMAEYMVRFRKETIDNDIKANGIELETKKLGLKTITLNHQLTYATIQTEEERAPLIRQQAQAIASEQYRAFEKLGILKKDQTLRQWVAVRKIDQARKELDLASKRATNDSDRVAIEMMRFQLAYKQQGFTEIQAKENAARWMLEHEARFGPKEYQEDLRKAILETEKGKPGEARARLKIIQEEQKRKIAVDQAGGPAAVAKVAEERIDTEKGYRDIGETTATLRGMMLTAAADTKAGKKDTPEQLLGNAVNRLNVQSQGGTGLGLRTESHDSIKLKAALAEDSWNSEKYGEGFVEHMAKIQRDAQDSFPEFVQLYATEWPGGADAFREQLTEALRKQTNLVYKNMHRGDAPLGDAFEGEGRGDYLRRVGIPIPTRAQRWAGATREGLNPLNWPKEIYRGVFTGYSPSFDSIAGHKVLRGVLDVLDNPDAKVTWVTDSDLDQMYLTKRGGSE